jgi:hypothetical protein
MLIGENDAWIEYSHAGILLKVQHRQCTRHVEGPGGPRAVISPIFVLFFLSATAALSFLADFHYGDYQKK